MACLSSPNVKKEKTVLLVFGYGGHREQISRLCIKLRAEDPTIQFVCVHEPMRQTLSKTLESVSVRELRSKTGGKIQNLFSVFRCSVDSVRAIRHLRKHYDIRLAICTGPCLAIPALFCCRIVGIKTIFFESWSRFYHPSFSGKVCKYFVHQLYFQNQSMQKYYPKGKWSGRL